MQMTSRRTANGRRGGVAVMEAILDVGKMAPYD